MAPVPQQGIGIFPPTDDEPIPTPTPAPTTNERSSPGSPARGIGIFTPSTDDPLTKALKTNTLSPADAAEVLDLQRKTGFMADTITRNRDAIKRELAAYSFDSAAFRARSPKAAQWMGEQQERVAAFIHEQDRLAHLETTLNVGQMLLRAVDETKSLIGGSIEVAGQLLGASATPEGRWEGGFQVLGLLDPEPIRAFGERMRVENKALAEAWGRHTTFAEARQGEVGQYAAEIVAGTAPAVGLTMGGAYIGGAIGSFFGPGGTVVGAMIGALVPSVPLGVGSAQQAIQDVAPGTEAPGWAVVGGGAIAALDSAVPGKIGTRLVRVLGPRAAEQAALRMLKTPMKPGWFKVGVGGSIISITEEGVTEALQGAVETTVAAMATDTPFPTLEQYVARGIEEAIGGVIGGTAFTVPSTAISLPRERAQWEQAHAVAQQTVQVFDQLATGIINTKGLKDKPDATTEFLQALVKDGPLETIAIPVQPWIDYWTARGASPDVMAETLTGSRMSVQEALANGGTDLIVPTAKYGALMAPTEHHAAFAKELRLRPDLLNMREVEAQMAEAVTEAEAAAVTAVAEATPEQQAQWDVARQEVYDLVKARSLAAGSTRTVADAHARVQAAAFVQRAIRSGVNPSTLLGLRGPAGIASDVMTPEARAAAAAEVEPAPFPDLPPSRATPKESPEQRATRRTAQLAALTQALTRSARRLDPGVSEATISEELNFRIELEEERQRAASAGGRGKDLLRTIASKGGITIEATRGEFRDLAEEGLDERKRGTVMTRHGERRQTFGRREWGGVAGVFAEPGAGRGITPDEMRHLLVGDDPRFGYLAEVGPSELLEAIEDAMRSEADIDQVPGTQELAALGIDPNQRWWGDAWRTEDPAATESDAVDTGVGEVSFDTDEFLQRAAEHRVTVAQKAAAARAAARATRASRREQAFKQEAQDTTWRAPLFYSRLTQAVEASDLQKATGKQWKATIKNAKTGINADEWLFAHVSDLANATTYTRDQVLEYLAANTVDLRIIELGAEPDVNDPRVQALANEIYEQELQTWMGALAVPLPPYEASATYDEEAGQWVGQIAAPGEPARPVGAWATEEEALADAQHTLTEDVRAYGQQQRERAAERVDYDEAVRQAQERLADDGPLVKFAGDTGVNLGGPTVARSYREVFVTAPTAGKKADSGAFARALSPLEEHASPVVQDIARELRRIPGTADARLAFLEAEIADYRAAGDGVPMAFPLAPVTGSTSYREIAALLEDVREKVAVLPDDTTWTDGHAGYNAIANPIVRVRYDVRVLADGRTVLFLQELQAPLKAEFARMPKLLQEQWRELGMKWALAQAAELNLDVVGWTPGHVQTERYNLRKVVDVLEYYPATRQLNGFKDGNRTVVRTVPPEELKDYVGAEVTARLLAPEATVTNEAISRQVLAGKQLEVGGAGLARLYDQDFVRVANKLGKRYGARTETVPVDAGETGQRYDGPEVTADQLRADAAADVRNSGPDAMGATLARQAKDVARAMDGGLSFADAMAREASPALATHYGGTMTRIPTVVSSPAIAITPPMREAITGQGQALFQEEGAPPAEGRPPEGDAETRAAAPAPVITRGAYNPQTNLITLFAGKADLSTFLHESAHQFLEDMLFDVGLLPPPGARTRLQQQLADDLDLALQEIGFTGTVEQWRGMSNNARRAHHEFFARAFETYLMSGKAPSAELATLFQKFKHWLLDIVYKNAKALGVEVSPELAGVFDRLLASEEAIAAAKAETQMTTLFTDQAQAGVDTQTWLAHQARIQEASRLAQEDVDKRVLRDWQREQQADYKAEREILRPKVATEFNSRPAFVALSMIRTGRLPDGSIDPRNPSGAPMKLSRADLVGQFGLDVLPSLPRPYLYSAEGGIPVATAAELFGFPSADALIESLQNTPPVRQEIDAETDRRLQAEHADEMLDGMELQDVAENALHTHRAEIISAELDALTKGMVGARKTTAEQRRLAAEARIAQTRVRDLKPGLYLAAAQRASQRAFTAFSKNDRVAAVAAKEDELTALAMHRAARDAQATLATQRKQLEKYGSHTKTRQRLGKAGPEYLEQMDALLEDYEFKPVTQKRIDRRESLAAFIKSQIEHGLPVEIPADVVADTRRINYQQLTVGEVEGVYEAATMIAHLATLKNKLLKSVDKRDFTEIVTELSSSIRALKGNTAPAVAALGIEPRLPGTVKIRMAKTLEGWDFAHRKIASLARELDGFEDGGLFWNAVIRPLNEAGNREASMNAEASTALTLLFDRYTPRERSDWYVQRIVPGVGTGRNDPKANLSKQARFLIVLNMGNRVNYQRARDGYDYTDADMQAILASLDEKDEAFVQDLWDFIGHYWPEIAAKQQRVTGLEPERVEANPFTTPRGTVMRGGYFPLKYERKLSSKAATREDVEIGNMASLASHVAATTRRGHVKPRVDSEEFSDKIRLDFGVVFEHVGQVIHDLSHHETLVDVDRILRDQKVQDAIYEVMGDEGYAMFKQAIQDIAVGDVRARNGVERFANHIRVGGTVVGMGWSFMTALQQPFGLTQSMARIGVVHVSSALTRFIGGYGHMKRTIEDVQARSEFMRNRGRTMQREINEVRNTLGLDQNKVSLWVDEALRNVSADMVTKAAIADSYFAMIHGMQTMVDVPTWLAAEAKAMADPNNLKDDGTVDLERVVAIADQAVLDTQGGGQLKDLSSAQRGPVWLKMFTTYYSFFNTTYQLRREAERQFSRAPVSAESVGKLAAQYLLVIMVPAILSSALRDALKGEDEPEDYLEHAFWSPVAYWMGTMMFTRELAGAFQGYLNYEGPAGMRSMGDITKVITPMVTGKWSWKRTVKAAAAVTGALMQWPTAQVVRSIEGLMALFEGKTVNPAAVLVGPPRED